MQEKKESLEESIVALQVYTIELLLDKLDHQTTLTKDLQMIALEVGRLKGISEAIFKIVGSGVFEKKIVSTMIRELRDEYETIQLQYVEYMKVMDIK